MDAPITEGIPRDPRPDQAISLFAFCPFDENRLASADSRLGHLAPVLNRAYETSLAVRAIANLMRQFDMPAGEQPPGTLSASQLEAFVAAIAILSADLNKALCESADFLDGACHKTT